jgi:preprotein translocase subunit SecA
LSLEDDLMRIFGSDRISGLMQRLGMEEGVPIEHKMVTKAIERAQKQVEAQNFSVRKHLLEYDDVMNKQRESVYALRRELLEGQIHITEDQVVDTRGYLMTLAEELAESTVATYADAGTDPEQWDLDALKGAVSEIYGFEDDERDALDFSGKTADEMTDAIWEVAKAKYEKKEGILPDPAILHRVERDIMLQIVDAQWKDHLYSLDHLKEGIGLRGYGQRDPLVEYKKESFALFQQMRDRVEEEMVRYLWRLMPMIGDDPTQVAVPSAPKKPRTPPPMTLNAPSAAASSPFGAIRGGGSRSGATAVAEPPRPARSGGDDVVRQVKREEPKVGRNDPCPCGSGKKYKKCHGAA